MDIFTILYGLLEFPYIIDFIRLLKITNNKFKDLKSDDNNNSNSTYFRKKLIMIFNLIYNHLFRQ